MIVRGPGLRRATYQGRLGFAHESGVMGSDEWYTPAVIFEALRLDFDLDPCSPVEGPLPWIPARQHYTKADDGLMQPWSGRVWCNPPYGEHTRAWFRQLARHGDGVALVFARTDTEWFHEAVRTAAALCFIRGRVRFVDRAHRERRTPGAGSVLFAWGGASRDAVLRSGLGWAVGPQSTAA